MPAALLADFVDGDELHAGVTGGNPDSATGNGEYAHRRLRMQSWSGAPSLASMKISVDWYRIEMDDAIALLGADVYVPLCFDPRTNPEFSASHELCQMFSRNTVTGEIADLQDLRRNLVGFEVSGIDTQFDWAIPAGPVRCRSTYWWRGCRPTDVTKVAGLHAEDQLGLVGGLPRRLAA
jgi:hypothetical protein